MNALFHKVGCVLGPLMTILPVVTGAVPNGAAKGVLVTVGTVVTLLSNIFKGFAPKAP